MRATLAGNELKYVTEAVETNWISSAGSFIHSFEALFAEKMGARYGVACANGTVALHLALATLGLGPGDEVIIPTFTMIATANAVTYLGAKPVLVDSEPDTWNMDIDQVEAQDHPAHARRSSPYTPTATRWTWTRSTPSPRNTASSSWRTRPRRTARSYKGRPVGSLGDAASLQLLRQQDHHHGEGGMVTTNREDVARLAWNLRDHAFSTERHFWHKFMGYNYRMTNLQAAVGLAQTEQLEKFVAARRANARLLHPAAPPDSRHRHPAGGDLGDQRLLDVRHRAGRRVRADA